MREKRTKTLTERKERKTLKFSLSRLFLFLLIIVAIYILIGSDSGFVPLNSLEKEREMLILEITELEQRQAEMEQEKAKLERDLGYIEKVAREKLGMVKEGEILFRFVEEGAAKR